MNLYVPRDSDECCAWTNTPVSALPSRDRWTSGFSSSARRPACWWDSRLARAVADNATCTLYRGQTSDWAPGRIPAGSDLCAASRRLRNRKILSPPPVSPRGSTPAVAVDPRVELSRTEDRQASCSVDRVTLMLTRNRQSRISTFWDPETLM